MGRSFRNSSDVDIGIFGVGNVGQHIVKELCLLKLLNESFIGRIYMCGPSVRKLDAIREDLLSYFLMECQRLYIPLCEFLRLEQELIVSEVVSPIAVDIAILSFGTPLKGLVSPSKAAIGNQRGCLLKKHSEILSNVLDTIVGRPSKNPWIVSIVNPIEEICQRIALNRSFDENRVVGCSAELDAIRGLKYFIRERGTMTKSNIERFAYLGCHDEQGEFIGLNAQGTHVTAIGSSHWEDNAKREGSRVLHDKGSPPVFGPAGAVVRFVEALCCNKANPVKMSCSILSTPGREFSSVPIEVANFSIVRADIYIKTEGCTRDT